MKATRSATRISQCGPSPGTAPKAISYQVMVLCLNLTAGFLFCLAPTSGHAALVGRWVADDWAGGANNWVDRVAGRIATVPDATRSPIKTLGVFPQRGSNFASGLVFDGMDDYFSVAAAQNPIVGQTSVTIAALIRTSQGASGADGFYWQYPGPLNGESAGQPNDWGLTYNAAGNAQGFFNYEITPAPAVSLIDDEPHTMILTWQDPTAFPGQGVARLYVDGVLVGSTAEPQDGGNGIVNAGFVIGSGALDLRRFFHGAIGELRFYDSIQDPAALHAELATYLVVSTTNDSGLGSLRHVIAYASANETITFNPALSGQTVTLGGTQILIGKNLTIDASALPGGITISGNNASRVFEIANGTTVAMKGLTITGGNAPNGGGIYNSGTLALNNSALSSNYANAGGGIYSTGNLTLNNTTLSGNTVSFGGGGIFNGGTLTLNNTTIAGNAATNYGGGIGNLSGSVTLNNSTLAGNSALAQGGGVYVYGGTIGLNNSIIAGNTAPGGPDIDNTPGGGTVLPPTGVNLLSDLAGSSLTAGVSVLVGNPLLASLGSYGGPTKTLPPLPGSPAIDASSSGLANDQRGRPRPQGANFDIGAVEFESRTVTTAADSGPGSLRQVIADSPFAAITFAGNLNGGIITLGGTQLVINTGLTIDASALPGGITIHGSNASRIFEVASGATLVLDSLTLTGGKGANGIAGPTGQDGGTTQPGGRGDPGAPGASGGGILNQGTLTLNRVTLSGNAAGNGGRGGDGGPGLLQGAGGRGGNGGEGGAIFNSTTATLTILNSTIANNASGSGANGGSGTSSGDGGNGGSGGGIANAGILRLTQTTVTDNAGAARGSGGTGSASHGTGGGVRNTGTLNLTNTIVALNTAPGSSPDLSGSATAIGGVNFLGNPTGATGLGTAGVDYRTGDPMLAPLGNYGGPNHTRSPLDGSPVVDASSSGLATDQRGVARPRGASFDIGAVEAIWPVDVFGYARSAAPFAFEDISGSGTRVLANADDENFSAPLGFFFSFYGRSYSQVNFTPNGLITLGGTSTDFSNDDLTTAAPDGNFPSIAVLWDDWVTLTNGNPGADAVYYQMLGTPGDRRFILQWNNIFGHPTSPSGVTFQAILFETNGNILCQYLDVDSGNVRSNGAQATVGIRDTDGHLNGKNSQWSFNEAAITNGQAIVFRPVYVPAGPIELTGLTQLGNGSVQLAFTNASGALFTVLGSTNVALPLSEWSNLGPAVESPSGSGQFQFTDPQAPNFPQRFYRVNSP